jgi:phosphatidate phosphatase APP1
VRETAHVLTPTPDVEFGIISDMDDTVIRTGATTVLQQWRTILFNNAYTRRPFAGIDALYRALALGADEKGHNPLFYVSSSSWNLYMLFRNILDLHKIPAGPMLLRQYGIDPQKGISFGHRDHKIEQIEPILDTYPDLQFVLIGDSGQKDPEIYRELVASHPGRISAIYIRDVTTPERDREVHAIAEEVAEMGVPMVLVEDTIGAAEHAVEHGLINEAALPRIRRDKEEDEQRQELP